VVCGAPNVAAGQRIAFAKMGAKLLDTHTGHVETLKAARIRGVVSAGMVCSERELGLGTDHSGILVLEETAPVGVPLADFLGDTILDMEVTPNRPDWLSVLGVAREVAALTSGSVRETPIFYPEEGEPIESLVTIKVDAPDLAPRYTASLITGVHLGPSPRWMQDRLLKAGQRPINNLVDITNYVMLEYGQPLHAFDFDLLESKTVRVRHAAPGEMLVTLDGEDRALSTDMLVIADARRPVGLAGVMGGANSEVTEATTSVLLESASFNPASIRRTGGALKLRSEASIRFERNLNPDLAPVALRRATQLVYELAGGRVAQGIIDIYSGRRPVHSVRLTMSRVEKVLGIRPSLEEVCRVLASLGFQYQPQANAAILVMVPYWRSDIAIEDDLVEELARIKGYDAIPTTFLASAIPQHQPHPMRELSERVRDILVSAGMQEVISYTLTSRERLDKSGTAPGGPEPLRVANPMSPEQEYLRTTLRPSILATLASNQRSGQTGLRLFEVGRVYHPRAEDLPEEREMTIGVLWGGRTPLTWTGQAGNADFFDGKGVVEALLAALNLPGEFTAITDPLLHPGKSAAVTVAGQQVGIVGEVLPDALERFDVAGEAVVMFELDMELLLPLVSQASRRFVPLARFPGSYRDMALLVDIDVPASRLEAIIRRNSLVESVALFDVYTGPGVPDGKRSLAFRIHYQSPKETLTAEAVNAAQEQILRELEQETGARLRG
ncbi:MAG: phenylalanine--tRNA ligase subunit beta, partial [Dehalococcoidia bacterium]|nr:phenylalanine--tRNA ligase subunit beta [Dehalococcoidia bacterium]